MNKNKTSNIKLCPFCGSKEYVIIKESGGRRVCCKKCCASAGLGIDKEHAISQWNNRYAFSNEKDDTYKVKYEDLNMQQKRLFDMMPSSEQEKHLKELTLEKKLNNVCNKIIVLCRNEEIVVSEFEELINKLQVRQSFIQQQILANTKI